MRTVNQNTVYKSSYFLEELVGIGERINGDLYKSLIASFTIISDLHRFVFLSSIVSVAHVKIEVDLGSGRLPQILNCAHDSSFHLLTLLFVWLNHQQNSPDR